VELSVTRESGMTPHDFVIKAPEAGINVVVSLDTKPQLVKFTPTKAGKYPFVCTKKLIFMKSHKDKGMEGTLEVTE
jgi:plastocyanin